MKVSDYEAIIFDLGGVILPIDYSKTADAFKDLGLKNFDELYSQANQSGLFDRFEVGEISNSHFINSLLNYLPKNISANQVVHAWNSMLLDFPEENLNFLKELKLYQTIFLLSNTNEIHIQAFNRKLKENFNLNSLHSFFDDVYFSNEIKKRKPHPETFTYICDLNQLNPQKCLFIDDSIQHIEGAKQIGLQTYHFQKTNKITNLFN